MEQQEQNSTQTPPEPPKRRRLSRGWRIALISLASLVGLLLITVLVALWLVLTPARLTSIVNKLTDKYILCENHFERVDLTLIKTFPYVGVEVGKVTLVNPMDGAPSDTLARVGSVSVGFNLREFLKHKNIEVTRLVVEDVSANLYTDTLGQSNFAIFPTSDEPDTNKEPFNLPELVALKSIKVKNLDATYRNCQSHMDARLADLDLAVDGQYAAEKLDAKLKLSVEQLALVMQGDSTSLDADLKDIDLKLKADGTKAAFDGTLNLDVEQGTLAANGQQFVTEAMQTAKGNLLEVESDFTGDLNAMCIDFEKIALGLKDYEIKADGPVQLPNDEQPLTVDLSFETNQWNVDKLLQMLPPQFVTWKKKMQLDADLELAGTVKGAVTDTTMPVVAAHLLLKDGRFSDRSLLPYDFTGIKGDISANLDLGKQGVSSVDITSLAARTGRNTVSLTGHVDDLTGRMATDARVKGNIYLADAKPLLPPDMNMKLDGKANVDLHLKTTLAQLQKSDFKHMNLSGNIGLEQLDVAYDTIYAQIPKGNIKVQLPSAVGRGLFDELASAVITADGIKAQLPNNSIDATVGTTRLTAAVSNLLDTTQPLRLLCDFDLSALQGSMDTISADITHPSGTFAMIPASKTGKKVAYQVALNSEALNVSMGDSLSADVAGLTIKGKANYDPARPNVLQQWSPDLDIDFKRGYLHSNLLDYVLQIPDIKFNYKPERCEIASANVVFGNSDFYLSGAVTGLEDWLSHNDMLKGDLYLTSNYTNVDDLMNTFSGMGTDPDTLEQQRISDNVDTSAHPFIVPKDVDLTFHMRIKEALAFDNELRELAGDLRVRDGVAVLNQVGFVCKAARMQFTGMYRTPRLNHIFVGLDFHLLDINIQELIAMIPYVDTIVPLLNDLEGRADFHLCAETYVNAFYKPKMSTMRAAAALTGQDLVVLDNKDIDRIAKLLQLKKWREDDTKIHLDSLDVAMTLFRKELEVYPFLLSLHKYQIVAEGRHNLSNAYDYHVELVQTPLPVRLAVDVFGTMPQLKFDLSPKLRYKNLYRPAKRNEVDEQVLRLKAMIRESLEANVKQSTREYQGLGDE